MREPIHQSSHVGSAGGAGAVGFDEIRGEFPMLDKMIYLNTAANGLIPERGRIVLESFFREAQYLEGLARAGAFEALAETRQEAATLLDCDAAAIALTFNTSHGLNVAANTLSYEPGDNVVLAHGEFPANVYPWLNLESRGVEVRLIECGLRADAEALLAACDARTRVVAVSMLQFHDGYRPDVQLLAQRCRERGIRTVADGIQAIGCTVVRPQALGLDFVATGGQKWLLSPRGTGLLYVRPDLIPELQTPILGWLNVDYEGRFDSLLRYPRTLFADARRFELGTPNLHDILVLRESLRLLNELGIERIEEHNLHLAEMLRTGLEAIDAVRLRAAGPRPSPIVSFELADAARVELVREALARARVHCAFREGRFRMAVHLYNRAADVERTLESVRESASGGP
ncbi:MAG: aminotransferase class V-fold PLP-dependent enzyme [Candidatus Latescibacterota bacterium]|nr:MAG: aminotransferase class V-fold PLP-dependent enzyme [Candidatus Latescibacterota bacterium]